MIQLTYNENHDLGDHFLLDGTLHPRNKINLFNYLNNSIASIITIKLSDVIPQSDGIVASNTNVVDETTTFEDAKESLEETIPMQIAPTIAPFNESTVKSIQSYLMRPIIIADGDITAATPANLVTSGFLHTALQHPSYKNKLEGVYALRYTSVLTLKVNASRFQTGCLMLCWTPFGGDIGASKDLRATINYGSLTQWTQTLNVKASFAYDSSVTLRIPFVSDRYCHPNTPNPLGNPGGWDLVLYSPLLFDTGSAKVPYTLYQHFEDVEMFGAVVPQSNITITKKKDVFSKEMFSSRPVSTTLSMGAAVSSAVSSIPILSPIATPVSWVMDALSRAAYIWGYSNPRIITKAQRYINNSFPYFNNSDGGDIAQSLGLSVSASINIKEGMGGTKADEMSVDFLKNKYSFIESFGYLATAVPGTIIFERDVAPSQMFTVGVTSATSNYTPLGYLAIISQRWTGGIQFRFNLFKSPFHTGRLAFIFQPSSGYGLTAPTLSNLEYTSKVIVDITDCNVIDITIPYISVNTWEFWNGSIGKLYVMVVDELISPADVNAAFNINVEARGAKDFQIAQPGFKRISVAVAQSGIELDADTLDISLGTSSVSTIDYSKNADCIGETFESLKNLMVVYRQLPSLPTISDTNSLIVQPYFIQYKAAAAYSTNVRDHLSYLVSLYALFRGGMNLALSPLGTLGGAIVPFIGPHQAANSYIINGATTVSATQSTVSHSQANLYRVGKCTAAINVPFYSNTPAVPSSRFLYNASAGATTNTTDNKESVTFAAIGVSSGIQCIISRSAADDFQCMNFMSIPTLVAL